MIRFIMLFLALLPAEIFTQSNNLVFDTVLPGRSRNQMFVDCIMQDSRGFMWFGTHDGRFRYDRYNMIDVRGNPGDQNSISFNRVNALLEDAGHILWIGTATSLFRYYRNYLNRQLDRRPAEAHPENGWIR